MQPRKPPPLREIPDYSWAKKEPHRFLILHSAELTVPPKVPVYQPKEIPNLPFDLCYTCRTLNASGKKLLDIGSHPNMCNQCYAKLSDWLEGVVHPKEIPIWRVVFPLSPNQSHFETREQAITYCETLMLAWIPFTLYSPDNDIIAHLCYADSKAKFVSEDMRKWLKVFTE